MANLTRNGMLKNLLNFEEYALYCIVHSKAFY